LYFKEEGKEQKVVEMAKQLFNVSLLSSPFTMLFRKHPIKVFLIKPGETVAVQTRYRYRRKQQTVSTKTRKRSLYSWI